MNINLATLPAEILIPIFVQLPAKDGFNLSLSCKRLHEIFQHEMIWEKKIILNHGINVKRPKEEMLKHEIGITAANFYKFVLYKFGHLLGVWQRTNFGHYGAIYQVCVHRYKINSISEWVKHNC